MSKGITAENLRPLKGEISVDEALDACERFLSLVRLPIPKDAVPVVKLHRRVKERSKSYQVFYESIYEFAVRADIGTVQMFVNRERKLEYALGKRRRVPYAATDPMNAIGFASPIGKLLGSLSRYRICHTKPSSRGDLVNSGLNRSGLTELQFEAYLHGYPLGNYDSCSLSIDSADGVLMSFFMRQTPYRIESFAAKLSINNARAKAASAVNDYGVGKNRDGRWEHVRWVDSHKRLQPSRSESRLQYVCPNGLFGGLKYSENESPKRLRLAWVLYYSGDDAVFVDAGDGRILGGILKVWK